MGGDGDKWVIHHALSKWQFSHHLILIMEAVHEFFVLSKPRLGAYAYTGEAHIEAEVYWKGDTVKGVHLVSATLLPDTDEIIDVDLTDEANAPLIDFWEAQVADHAQDFEIGRRKTIYHP